MIEFFITLGTAFFNQGFINIPVAHDEQFGDHNDHLSVFLGSWNNLPIDSWINREAQPNHSPRIMMGIDYTHWVQANHNLGDNILVSFNNPIYPNSILIQ